MTLTDVTEKFQSIDGSKDSIDLEVNLIYDFAEKHFGEKTFSTNNSDLEIRTVL